MRAMSPSAACATPGRGCSRRLRSRKAPARKNGGAFLPTARQTGPSHHDRRRSLDSGFLQTGSPRPTKSLPIPDRPPAPTPAPPESGASASLVPPQRMARCQRHAATPGPEGKSLTRTTWPSPSTTGASTASRTNPNHRRRTTCPGKDDSRPRTHATPIYPCAAGPSRKTRPDAFAYCVEG